ncbi:MAG: response regulator transcription factor [Gammaproteobacteria bacterium]|jgi:DNA-binding response OmpR family regulator
MNAPARHILLVEDEPGLVLTLTDRLRSEGFEVSVATDGYTAVETGQRQCFDLVLIDIMLPGQDGFEVCAQLRRRDARTPILMLTARGEVEDRVRGLQLGADDYLQKPFAMSELLARIEALLRRAGPASRRLRIGRVEVDFDAGTVTAGDESLELSAQSLRLLEYLVAHGGQAVTRETLLSEVWGHKSAPSTRTVDMHVAWLRRALEPDPGEPRHIVTVHGVGYRFDP